MTSQNVSLWDINKAIWVIVLFMMENSSEIPAHGIYLSVKLFLQPIKLLEISIMMRSWNYCLLEVLNRQKAELPRLTSWSHINASKQTPLLDDTDISSAFSSCHGHIIPHFLLRIETQQE